MIGAAAERIGCRSDAGFKGKGKRVEFRADLIRIRYIMEHGGGLVSVAFGIKPLFDLRYKLRFKRCVAACERNSCGSFTGGFMPLKRTSRPVLPTPSAIVRQALNRH